VHLALVGMMGSGKTTIGVRVAAARHRPFLDSDQMIEAREGRTVRDIWLAEGEPVYRVMESEVLREALASPDPVVIGAAGGVVLREENRRLLERADVLTVRLHAAPEVLVDRVGRQGHRPLLDDDPLAALRRLTAEREALYREVADVTVEVGEATVEEITEQVLDALDDRERE
jgi:shikimate kinase